MRLAFARGWLPALVSYSDGLPEHIGGMTLAFVVVIRPKYRDDHGLHEHELELVTQWYAVLAAMLILAIVAYFQGQAGMAAGFTLASTGAHGFLYRHWARFRLVSETQAYGRQMLFPDHKGRYMPLTDAVARLCSRRYGFNLSPGEAEAKLRTERGTSRSGLNDRPPEPH